MTAVDHAELKRVAEGEASWSLGIYKNRDQADDAAKFRAMDLPAVVLALLSEIEGLKAERDAAMTLDKGFYEWMVERDLLARGEEVDWSDIVVALTEHEIECCPDPLRTQAPDSWRPDREAVANIVWERFAPSHDMDPENAKRGEYIMAADAILALRPQAAESGE